MALPRNESKRATMTPERSQRIEEILENALLLDTSQRDSFIENAGAGDEELKREVRSLLKAHEDAGNRFLNVGACHAAEPTSGEVSTTVKPAICPSERARQDPRSRRVPSGQTSRPKPLLVSDKAFIHYFDTLK
jgi:hypothetical protein